MVITTRILGYLQLKSNALEKLFTGKALIIIEKGALNTANLMKVGLTVDQLEMQLRQANVKKIEDVEWATLEPNGRVGFILKESAQPVTREDLQAFLKMIDERLAAISVQDGVQLTNKNPLQSQADNTNIFTEIAKTSSTSQKHLN